MNLVHFPLHPETPAEGLPLEKLFGRTSPEERAARQERMQKLMPRCTVECIEHAGHALFTDRPEEFAESVGRFLAGSDLGTG